MNNYTKEKIIGIKEKILNVFIYLFFLGCIILIITFSIKHIISFELFIILYLIAVIIIPPSFGGIILLIDNTKNTNNKKKGSEK